MSLFLRCLGEAIAARGMRGLADGVPFGGLVYDVAADVIDRYREQNRLRQIASDLEQVVQAESRDLRVEIAEVAEKAAAGKAEIARQIESYLLQVPAVVQRSLRRPEDPRGATVPAAAKLDDPAQLAALLPQRLPRFRAGQAVPHAPGWVLDRLLGAGGFGEVWLATHPSLRGQQRAFKFCLDREARERLLRHEGQVIQRVMRASKAVTADQQGIVPLLDAHLDGETPWLAYEYIDGGDLAGLAKASQARDPAARGRAALKLLQRLATIVGELHRLPEPVIHRDLKPANVLVKKVGNGFVLRVTDFGIGHIAADQAIRHATVSTPQASLGATLRGAHSPIYASPQQKRGLKPDVRDDVHALGVIGYQLLLTDLQAERPSGVSWRRKVAACGLQDPVLDLLGRCWEDDPADRPADAKALADELAAATAPPPLPVGGARPAPADESDEVEDLAREAYRERAARRVRRRKPSGRLPQVASLVGLLAALAGLVFAGVMILPSFRTNPAEPTRRISDPGPDRRKSPALITPQPTPPPDAPNEGVAYKDFFSGEFQVYYQAARRQGSWTITSFDEKTNQFAGRFDHPFNNHQGSLTGSVSGPGIVRATLTAADAKGKVVEFEVEMTIPVRPGVVTGAAAEGTLVWTYIREDKDGRPIGVVPEGQRTRHEYRLQKGAAPVQTTPPGSGGVAQVPGHLKSIELAQRATAGEIPDVDRQVDQLLAETPLGESGDGVRYNAACVLSLGSRYGTDVDRERRAARAVKLLTGLLDGPFYRGPTNAAHIDRDADLNPVRGRADFRAFRERLQASSTYELKEFLSGELKTEYQAGKQPGTWSVSRFDEKTGRFEGTVIHPAAEGKQEGKVFGVVKGGRLEAVIDIVVTDRGQLDMIGEKGPKCEIRISVDLTLPLRDGKIERGTRAVGTVSYVRVYPTFQRFNPNSHYYSLRKE
ncbi:MAG: serine/threonine-protein kinase [Gemmataceae bacterium]